MYWVIVDECTRGQSEPSKLQCMMNRRRIDDDIVDDKKSEVSLYRERRRKFDIVEIRAMKVVVESFKYHGWREE